MPLFNPPTPQAPRVEELAPNVLRVPDLPADSRASLSTVLHRAEAELRGRGHQTELDNYEGSARWAGALHATLSAPG